MNCKIFKVISKYSSAIMRVKDVYFFGIVDGQVTVKAESNNHNIPASVDEFDVNFIIGEENEIGAAPKTPKMTLEEMWELEAEHSCMVGNPSITPAGPI